MSSARLIVVLAVASLAAGEASAQARRWTVMLEIGLPRSGATGVMEGAMRDAGYDDTTPPMCLLGYCSPGHGHPASSGPEPAIAGASLRYALRPGLQVRAVLAPTASLGSTMGYRADPNQPFGGSYAELAVRAGSVGLALAPVTGDVAWLELGPALVWGDVRSASGSSAAASGSRPGLLAGAGLNLTPGRRLAVELAARYRLAGSLSVQPFGTTGATVDVPLSYATLGANVGIRF